MEQITTVEQLEAVIKLAMDKAYEAAHDYLKNELQGIDQYACGFAWTTINEYDGKRITGNTKMGRLLKKAGIGQNYMRQFYIWNPAKIAVQNVDCIEAGARAAAEVFNAHGFRASSGSRLD